MTTVEWKFLHTASDLVTTTDLTEFYDPSFRTKMGDGKDSFEFKVNNIAGDFNLFFNPNDKIIVSRKSGSVVGWSDSNIIMNAAIRTVPQEIGPTKDLLRVSGFNYSESVGGVLIFNDGGTSGTNVSQFLHFCVNTASERNKEFPITWHPDNPTLKQDNVTSFPSITDKVFNKTLNYALEKYSTNEYTEDGNYYYYVDKDNYLVWGPRDGNISNSFDESTDIHKSIKISKDIKDVKNYIIVKGGYDSNRNSIQAYVPDYASIAKNGFKYYIFTDETRKAEDNLNADLNTAGVDKMEDANFGTFNASWGTGDSFSDYANYVSEFRAYHKNLLKKLGLSYISL